MYRVGPFSGNSRQFSGNLVGPLERDKPEGWNPVRESHFPVPLRRDRQGGQTLPPRAFRASPVPFEPLCAPREACSQNYIACNEDFNSKASKGLQVGANESRQEIVPVFSLRAKGTLISEPRFSTPCEMRFFPREKGKTAFSKKNSRQRPFPFLAWEKSLLAGGRKSGLTN